VEAQADAQRRFLISAAIPLFAQLSGNSVRVHAFFTPESADQGRWSTGTPRISSSSLACPIPFWAA